MLSENVTNFILNRLMKENRIQNEHREIYAYALEKMYTAIVNIVITILIAFLFHMEFEILVFMLFYIPLRNTAGGFHAKTRTQCTILSVASILILIKSAVLVAEFRLWQWIVAISIFIVLFLVYKFAPVDTANKRLTPEIKLHKRKRAKQIAWIESLILLTCILILPTMKIYIVTAVMAMLLLGVAIIPYKNQGGLYYEENGNKG